METFCGFGEFASRDTKWKCKKLNIIVLYNSLDWLIKKNACLHLVG